MKATTAQFQQMLRDGGLKYLVEDDGDTFMCPFDGDGEEFYVFVCPSEDEVKLVGKPSPRARRDDPRDSAVCDEMLAINYESVLLSVSRSAELETLSLTHFFAMPDAGDDPEPVADRISMFANEVGTALTRLAQVKETGKTKRQRDIDDGLDKLFNPVNQDAPQESQQ